MRAIERFGSRGATQMRGSKLRLAAIHRTAGDRFVTFLISIIVGGVLSLSALILSGFGVFAYPIIVLGRLLGTGYCLKRERRITDPARFCGLAIGAAAWGLFECFIVIMFAVGAWPLP